MERLCREIYIVFFYIIKNGKKKGKYIDMKNIILITQIGISMMVPIFVGVFIGRYLDNKFNLRFCTLIFLFLGIITGMRNVYQIVKKYL